MFAVVYMYNYLRCLYTPSIMFRFTKLSFRGKRFWSTNVVYWRFVRVVAYGIQQPQLNGRCPASLLYYTLYILYVHVRSHDESAHNVTESDALPHVRLGAEWINNID